LNSQDPRHRNHRRSLFIELLEDRRLLSVSPFAVPLEVVEPLGSLVYDGAVEETIATVGEVDSFTIDLDDGQTVTLLVEPDNTAGATLQPTVELIDPDGATIGTAGSNAVGDAALLQTIATTGAGTYTLNIADTADALGDYSARLILNAAVETETYGSATNNDLASAEDLQPSFIAIDETTAARGAVLGKLGQAGDQQDWYRFTLDDGQSASVVVWPQMKNKVELELYDDSESLITFGVDSGRGSRTIEDFVDTTDGLLGTYYLRATSAADTYYSLSISRCAALNLVPHNNIVVPPQDITSTGNALGAFGRCAAWQQQEILASDAAAYDRYGRSVSISGDTAVVGAADDDDGGDRSGSAYIVQFDGNQWIEKQKLTASDAARDDRFGYSVAISGNTAIVGAYRDKNGRGSAYVFQFDGEQWTQRQKLTASDAYADDWFGCSVAIGGNKAIVGAYGDACGSAYVFHFDGDNWSEKQKLTAAGATGCGFFGTSVAISGNTAIVGADNGDHDSGLQNTGAAYVFHFDGERWTEQQKLNASGAAAKDAFGRSVAISGNAAIVGAPSPFAIGAGSDSGSAYVFHFDGEQWIERQKLTMVGAAARFGNSVAIGGNTAIVGAPRADNAGNDSGLAYTYHFDGDQWVAQQTLTIADASPGDDFGRAVAVSGNTVIVSAGNRSIPGLPNCGTAYIHVAEPEPAIEAAESYVVNVDVGDELVVSTVTPGDGMVGAVNPLDPVVELYDPEGNLVETDDNGAADARNALLRHTALVSGAYKIRVLATNDTWGEYILSVGGHTGPLSPFVVTGSDPADGASSMVSPAQMRIDFAESVQLNTVEPTDLTIGGVDASGVTIIDSHTIAFDLPTFPNGTHTATIAAGVILDLQGTPIGPFSTQFIIDPVPRVIESSILEGDIVSTGNLVYTARFDEELDTTHLYWGNATLVSQFNETFWPDVFDYDPVDSTLRLEFNGLPEDSFELTLHSGDYEFRDLTGNHLDGEPDPLQTVPSGDGEPGGDFVVQFTIDIPSMAVGPFQRLQPLGSLMSASRNAGRVDYPGDWDEYTFSAVAGEIFSVVVYPEDPDATLSIELPGLCDPVSAGAPGGPVGVPTAVAPATGTYSVRITGDGASKYQVRIGRNCSAEVFNTDDGSELPIDDSLLTLGPDRYGLVATSRRDNSIDARVWGVQPATGQIVTLDPATGWVRNSFPAPDALVPHHTQIGLTIAENGHSLLYVNSDVDPNVLYRLDPVSGAVLSTETTAGANYDGLGYDTVHGEDVLYPITGPRPTVFLGNGGVEIRSRNGFSGESWLFAVGPPSGAVGGDGMGRQFAFVPEMGIVEFDQLVPDTVLNTLPSPAADVEGLAFDGRRLYASTAAGSLYTLDPETGDVLHEIIAPGGPMFGLGTLASPAADPGRLFATVKGDRTIVELDPQTGAVINEFDTPGRPSLLIHSHTGLAFDGTTLFFITEDNYSHVLYQLDPDTGEVLDELPLPYDDVEGLAALNGKVYVFNEETKLIHVFDPVGNQIIRTLDVSFMGNVQNALGAATETGSLFAMVEWPDEVVEFDPITGSVRNRFPLPDEIKGLAAVDGEIFCGTYSGWPQILVYSRGGELLRTLDMPRGIYGLAGDGRPGNELAARTELLVNGSFETGDFTGWTATENGQGELTPWTVGPRAGGFFYNSSPTSGRYSAYNGFDGISNLEYELYQDVTIPADGDSVYLTTNHHVVHTGGTGRDSRSFEISVRDTDNNLLKTLYEETLPEDFIAETDSGWNRFRFDLTEFQGQTVRIHFYQFAPADDLYYGYFKGPAMFEVDDISLAVEQPPWWFLPEVDEYTLDLTGKAGHPVDVLLAGQDGADFSAEVLQLLDTDGQTVLATATADPLGVAATNYDLAILDFTVPADGVYTLRMTSLVEGKYGVVVTDRLVMESEPNDTAGDPLRSLNGPGKAVGYLAPGDVDTYEITLAVGETLIAHTETSTGNSLPTSSDLDPELTLYDPAATPVAADQNTENGTDARLMFTAATAGSYTLVVSAEAGSGEYLVGADVLDAGPQVVRRGIFYNNSAFAADTIAPDKTALLPGQTARFANYASYSRGINGIAVDVVDLTGTPTAGDFEFKVGNDDDPGSWPSVETLPEVTVQNGQGMGGSDRVTIVWPDNTIENTWLQVTVLPTANTGLTEPDVFYFGNAIGESGNSAVEARVNAVDILLARNNPRNLVEPVPADFRYDYNRDGRVNATDMLIARENQTHLLDGLKLIAVPESAEQAAAAASAGVENSSVKIDWLHELEQIQVRQRPSQKDGPGEEDGTDAKLMHLYCRE